MFNKVDQPDFLAGEHVVLRFWKEQDVFRKLQEQNRGGPKWSFLDGPITANNPMGVHHAWGRTYKDAYQRYFAMTGHELRYQNGFDCQGLWVEVEVEKELALGTKAAIAEYGIDRFVREGKNRVLRFAARQTEQSQRLGFWMEWDDPDELRKLAEAMGDVGDGKSEVGGQRSEVRGQRSEVRGQRPEARGQRPEARGQRFLKSSHESRVTSHESRLLQFRVTRHAVLTTTRALGDVRLAGHRRAKDVGDETLLGGAHFGKPLRDQPDRAIVFGQDRQRSRSRPHLGHVA